jgi:outer membrane immunogenic protein
VRVIGLFATYIVGFLGLALASIASANAGDLEAPPPLAPEPAYSWTGCHSGLHAGGALGHSQHFQDDFRSPAAVGLPETNLFKVDGVLLGIDTGCDYQLGRWVLGSESDLSWTNEKGTGNIIPPFTPSTDTFETSATWLSTHRTRIGVAWDRWLAYGTVGLAVAKEGITACNPAYGCGSSSHIVAGLALGAGAEYAFWGTWSLKIEYLYAHFDTSYFPGAQTGTGAFFARDVQLNNHIFRLGVDHNFNPFAQTR